MTEAQPIHEGPNWHHLLWPSVQVWGGEGQHMALGTLKHAVKAAEGQTIPHASLDAAYEVLCNSRLVTPYI